MKSKSTAEIITRMNIDSLASRFGYGEGVTLQGTHSLAPTMYFRMAAPGFHANCLDWTTAERARFFSEGLLRHIAMVVSNGLVCLTLAEERPDIRDDVPAAPQEVVERIVPDEHILKNKKNVFDNKLLMLLGAEYILLRHWNERLLDRIDHEVEDIPDELLALSNLVTSRARSVEELIYSIVYHDLTCPSRNRTNCSGGYVFDNFQELYERQELEFLRDLEEDTLETLVSEVHSSDCLAGMLAHSEVDGDTGITQRHITQEDIDNLSINLQGGYLSSDTEETRYSKSSTFILR